ncbi:hypothetical protein RclHR1_00280005 [Rhizophagus clarus]|uniref:Crinkler effector protein N-terminal domain-containing protein n=1 Tax=Rhizophagus clarus TaxID=94130 RepID=A0A2Z6R2S0_9GLOM|nr:hypothetical protein RclHR1_00280005 [Rhizophagus clarus]
MVFCLVLGEVPSRTRNFVVDITNEMIYVSHIQRAVRDAKKEDPPFNSIPFNKIGLWKVSIPTNYENDKLKTLDTIPSHEIDIKEQLGGEEMYPNTRIENYLSQNNPTNNHIHIIVRPLPPVTTAGTFIMGPAGLVHLFVDNSNLNVQGKENVAKFERLGRFNDEGVLSFDELIIDYSRLLEVILDNRKVGGTPCIVGSYLPLYDSLCSFVESNEFEVEVFERNCTKHVDMEITRAITKTAITNGPGTLILILGDKDLHLGIKETIGRLKFGFGLKIYIQV